MLNPKAKADQYENGSRPMAELLPWLQRINRNLVLNKDGSLLALFTFAGEDMEGREIHTRDQSVQMMENSLRILSNRITLHSIVRRRRSFEYPTREFPDPISELIDREYAQDLVKSGCYCNSHILAVLYRPEVGVGKIADMVHRYTVEGVPFLKALVRGVRAAMSHQAQFEAQLEDLAGAVSSFERLMEQWTASIPDIGLARLEGDAMLTELHTQVSPASEQESCALDPDAYLDSMLGSNSLDVKAEHLEFRRNERRYVGAFSIKTWPKKGYPGILDVLLAVPAELTITQTYRLLDHAEAMRYMTRVKAHNKNFQKPLAAYIKEAVSKVPSREVNEDRSVRVREAEEALSDAATHSRVHGFFNLTVLVYGDSVEELEDSMRAVVKAIQQAGMIAIRESMHLLSAWASSLAGQWAETVRWVFYGGNNFADAVNIRSIQTGSPLNEHLSEQAGRPVPALASFATRYATPYNFNFHQGDLGHTIVVGPPGAGKTVFLNFLTSQFRSYQPSNVFIFDKRYSCKIPTVLQGGRHLDVGGDNLKLNPLSLLGNRGDWPFLTRWVETLFGARGYQLTAGDSELLWEAIESTASQAPQFWRLRTLRAHLPPRLQKELAEWVEDGPRGYYFDNAEDTFDISSFLCMEVGELSKDPIAEVAFTDYAFHRIEKMLDGRPTMIYVEEAWAWLQNENYAARLDDWLRTLRKLQAIVVLSTQSLQELAQSKIFVTLVDSIPTRIFLANPNAGVHRELYQGRFGLNDVQVETLRTMSPKGEYYITTPSLSRQIDARFSPRVLACLRSDKKALHAFDMYRDTGPQWEHRYIEEVARNVQ